MKDKGHILQLASVGHLIKAAGAYRVSLTAKKELRRVLEEYALELSRKAIKFASHASRLTVKGEDISLAVNH